MGQLLGADDASPTLHPRWYLAAARTIHPGEPLHASVVTRGNEVAAVAPAVRVRHLGGELLELLGSRSLHQPSGLAHRDPRILLWVARDLLRARPWARVS